MLGTQEFMPPEALEDPPQYDLSVDVFSFGCVIIHLIANASVAKINWSNSEV